MVVKITLPNRMWTQMRMGETFTVVRDRNFMKTRQYIILVNGKETVNRIDSDECEVLNYNYPVYYSDYTNQIKQKQKREFRKSLLMGGV